MPEKPLVWAGSSLEIVRSFPDDVRRMAGLQLRAVQRGEEPDDWKPMPSIGLGVREIRLRSGGAYRIVYVARLAEAVYVLHAFEKRSQKTSRKDLELATARLKEVYRLRGTVQP